ncbi:MAG TPA: hypothetical protein PLR99_26295 [Polyangiaceae bacterium]|nr:hypothetical protein [Polyangiaceae bacterium]
MGWLQRFFQALAPLPSFDELESECRARGRRRSRASAREAIAAHPLLAPPAAREARDALLARLDGRLDEGTRDACEALLGEALEAQGFLARPGTIEDVWHLRGLLDRAASPE